MERANTNSAAAVHAGGVIYTAPWQQLDAMALDCDDNLRPHVAAHMPLTAFFGNVQLATDLNALHGSRGDVGGIGKLGVARAHIAVSWRPSNVDTSRTIRVCGSSC
jgi:hypothetical protein